MVKVLCESPQGGAVELNAKHGVIASYAVATVADEAPAELLFAWITLRDGRTVQCFVNRESGLIVVDIANKGGKDGVEILRHKA